MFKRVIPVLRVSSSTAAEQFYGGKLGLQREFSYRPDPSRNDPCYQGWSRDGVLLHVTSFPGDGTPGASVVNLHVEDVDALHAELLAKSVPIDLAPTDQTWGEREMFVRDPDGNRLCFVHRPAR